MRPFIVLCFLLLCGCYAEEWNDMEERGATACGTSIEDMPWLKEMIADVYNNPDSQHCQLWSVEQGIYKGQTVFALQVGGALCCPCAGAAVYDCRGELVFVCEPEKEKKIKKRTLAWKRP